MKVTIEIECDSKEELLQHIKVIRKQIKDLKEGDFDSPTIELEDNNCYGDHQVIIQP